MDVCLVIGRGRQLRRLHSLAACILHDRSLVIDDSPLASASPPNRGSPSDARALGECVSEQIIVAGDLEAVEIFRLPTAFWWRMDTTVLRICITLRELGQNIFAIVSAAGSANLPIFRRHHILEVLSRAAELRVMENRFAFCQLGQNVEVLRGRVGRWPTINVISSVKWLVLCHIY